MSVGKHRTPVRPLDSQYVEMAYPGELLVDPNTGNIVYINNEKGQIFHKKPGTLTVKQGSTTLLNNGDLSGNLTITIPEFPDSVKPTSFTWKNGAAAGPTGSLKLSDASTVSFPAIPAATASISGIVTTGTQTFAGAKTFSSIITGSISGNAGTATKLRTARTILINLASAATASFDGSGNVTPGVTGVLGIENGGTGADTAAEARTSLGITPANIGAATASHTHTADEVSGWTDTNYYPTTWAWTAGTTTGPTAKLTGNGMSAVSIGAIPSASASASGIVTTGTQTFAGTKTFSSTISGSISGNAGTATKLKTARTITVNLASTTGASFDGSGNVTPGVTGILSIENGGTGADTAADARTSLGITPANIGAAAASHNHSAANITSGTLALARGGTGITVNPSMLINLASTTAASIFATSPRPGVTGVLPIKNGGTGADTAAEARTSLGITPANIGAAASSHTHSAANITSGTLALARGGTGITSNPSMLINLASTAAASVFTASPRPGVTGILGIENGGTGADNTGEATNNLAAASLAPGVYIKSNDDLDDYTTPGCYVCSSGTIAKTVVNAPVVDAGFMLSVYNTYGISSSNAYRTQIAMTYTGSIKCRYRNSQSVWSDWDSWDITGNNYYPTTWTWTNGATAGPTAKLTGNGMSAVSIGAIPAATASISGIVTTGAQTFAGAKTFSTSVATPKLTISTAGNTSGVSKVYDTSIATGWSGSAAPYTKAVTISGILATDRPVVDFRATGTYSTDKAAEEAFLNIYRAVTAANKITFYAHEKPTVSIPIQVKVVR